MIELKLLQAEKFQLEYVLKKYLEKYPHDINISSVVYKLEKVQAYEAKFKRVPTKYRMETPPPLKQRPFILQEDTTCGFCNEELKKGEDAYFVQNVPRHVMHGVPEVG